jgi:hypothetical protein
LENSAKKPMWTRKNAEKSPKSYVLESFPAYLVSRVSKREMKKKRKKKPKKKNAENSPKGYALKSWRESFPNFPNFRVCVLCLICLLWLKDC